WRTPMRFQVRQRPLRAPHFFHARGRQPAEEFRDSSLFTLEIKNGIQFGTINIVEGEVQNLDLCGFALRLELEPEHWAGGRALLANLLGGMQHARKNLAVVDGMTQLDLDTLTVEPNKISHAFKRAINTGRADLEAFVVDVLDLKNA